MENQSWEADPEIKAELEAMAGYSTTLDPKLSTAPKRKLKKSKSITKRHSKKSPKAAEITPSIPTSTIDQTELLNVIKQPAFTSDDKYKILEVRDKLIRLRTKKNTDITSAKHIVGTCPDMCPEKERLMREVQHQVSLYEQEPGEKTLNPALAVKQYSRSSADQEVPLPHELRPVTVLQRTMAYLLHKIVDLCDNTEANVSEWYHFLWDRTRGIRKDITQQELCCQGSVELVEQCARFHIHCSARLVAEDRSVFDQKINTENLTKCLQTLKYMYHDLELKSENCPNEAEFRAYVILLNLNDGNFMWEVQQLRKEIQKSKELQFALQVYSALDKNNYVRFFKLVRSTSYLNACILLRYFIQVRLQALKTIIKSHSPRRPHMQFPLLELQEVLAFEGVASTIDFVEYHGLQLNDTRTHVILEKRMFQMPELPYALDRAMNLIESKRQVSVGEVICGNFLTEIDFDQYIPYNSFDDNGFVDISEYLPDIDIKSLQKEEKIEAKNVSEDKSNDGLSKTSSSIFQKSIFALKNTESRSNSPMDMTDRSSEPKSESVPFWTKPEKITSSIFTKPNVTNQGNIFKMANQDVSSQNYLLKSFIDDPKPIFGSKSQSSIFKQPISHTPNKLVQEAPRMAPFPQVSSQEIPKFPPFIQNIPKSVGFPVTESLPKPIGYREPPPGYIEYPVPTQSAPSQSLFGIPETPNIPISIQGPGTQLPQFSQNFDTIQYNNPAMQFPVTSQEVPQSTHFQKLPHPAWRTQPSQIEEQPRKSGGFTFDLKTKGPLIGEYANKQLGFEPKSIEDQKSKQDEIKMLQEKLRLEKERLDEERKQLEEEQQRKMLAKKLELEKRRLEEERLRKEAEIRRLKEEKRRIERQKELERIRKIKEIEEQKRRERESAICAVMNQLITQVEDNIRLDKLQKISQKIQLRKAATYFEKWKNSVIINKRKRKAIDQWPIWISWTTPKQEALQLYTNHQQDALKYMKRYKGGFSLEVDLEKTINVDQIDLPTITHKILSNKFRNFNNKQHNFWKVDIFIASLSYMAPNLKWIEKIVSELFNWNEDCLLLEESKISSNKITYCVKKLDGYKQEDTNGYILIGDELSEEFYEDISKIIKGSRHMEVPTVILLQNNDDKQKLDDLLLESSGEIKVLNQRFTPEVLAIFIRESLIFLAKNVVKTPPLELNTLKSFLHKNLATEIWRRMTGYTKWNQPYKRTLTNPKIVVDLYNEAVSRLETIAFDEKSLNYANFPDVFRNQVDKEALLLPCDYSHFPPFWKNDSYRRKIRRVFNELHLPQFETNWPPRDFDDLDRMITRFCTKFFKIDPVKKSYKIIAGILKSFDHVGNFKMIKSVLWTSIMEILIIEKLKEIDFSLREPFVTDFNELFVIYNKNSLHDYNTSMWFYITNPVVEKGINIEEYCENIEVDDDIVIEEVESEDDFIDDINFEATYLEIAEEKYRREERLNASKSDLKEFEDLMGDLEQSISIQKKISKRFEDNLRRALNDV